ncbi:MSCRAMM family protein [Actinokineospora globicatena]|uniref:MSCRAMM family protein n=1 Tax=Actinokineospora globicatena TaxID=103729 RepID=UPI0020A4335B|nr:prealbumin-like fold domain-containing protein [Actinokineospora globicatena]MCP2300580.1 Cna protein B-type domain [Actinokineospora globicatena]GLW81125.1 hypothetical protein Aglo01_56060 [Actinokineospora globicatena]GLW88318.1 hypothetical protein Aglo02_59570 [Actinokineospora globicatena]
MRRSTLGARLSSAVATVATLSAALLVVGAPPAAAEYKKGPGIGVALQPYKDPPREATEDWLGSYLVNGKQVWCVKFAFKEPDTNEVYQPSDVLKTKYGAALDPVHAADISYLLLRYADTKDTAESAALAHLLHQWTAAPRTPADLDPATNGFRTIAYNVPFHERALEEKLPGAMRTVAKLRADATANHGPWTPLLTKPTKPQVIGTPDTWPIEVRGAGGSGVGKVPVKVVLTDATSGGKTELTATTKDNGGPIALEVVPTGPKPSVSISLLAPADQPVVQHAVEDGTQSVVSTGGEKELKAAADTTAVTAPGQVAVAKVDEKTGQGIASVSLKVTGADKTTPAVDQDGKPLVGADGKPLVVVTGADGKATVPNLRTPQEVCVTEVAAPPGYEQSYDPNNPPSACGKLEPGKTVELRLVNKPNVPTVPQTIPAGDGPANAAAVLDAGGPSTGLLVALGALLLFAAGAGTALVRKGRGPIVVGRRMRKDWGH